MVYYDFHSHILPGMDDGAQDEEMSKEMLVRLKNQGVENVMLTPHFWCWEETVEEFLLRRDEAFLRLKAVYDKDIMPSIGIGAEVALRQGVSRMDCKALSFCGDYILLELPEVYGEWIIDEVENIMLKGLRPVFAHIERPFISYSKRQFEKLIDCRSFIYQTNVSALTSRGIRNHFIKYFLQGAKFILGSDAHNLKGRAPDFDNKSLEGRKLIASGFMDAVEQNSNYILSKVGNLYGEL